MNEIPFVEYLVGNVLAPSVMIILFPLTLILFRLAPAVLFACSELSLIGDFTLAVILNSETILFRVEELSFVDHQACIFVFDVHLTRNPSTFFILVGALA